MKIEVQPANIVRPKTWPTKNTECEINNYGGARSKTWNKCSKGARLVNIRGYSQHKIKTEVWDKEKGGSQSKTWNKCSRGARLVKIKGTHSIKLKQGCTK